MYWQTSPTGTSLTNRHTMQVSTSNTYYARIKNSSGCWSSATPYNVTIQSIPYGGSLAPFTVTRYGSVFETLQYTPPPSGTVTYWYKENGQEYQIGNFANISFSNPSSSDKVREYWARVQLGGCYNVSNSTFITVRPIPTVPNITVCSGENTAHSITDAISSCYGTLQYVGSTGPSINIGSGTNFNVTWGAPGIYTIVRRFSCSPSVATDLINQTTIQVLAKPAAATPSQIQQVAGCGEVTLNYTGSENNAYWHSLPNKTFEDEEHRVSRTVSTPSTPYYLRIKGSNGCWSDDYEEQVGAIAPPAIGGTITGGGGFYVSVNTTLTVGGYFDTVHQWRYTEGSDPTEHVIASTSPNLPVSWTGPKTREYWAVIRRGSCYANSSKKIVSVYDLPTPTVTACVGDVGTYNAPFISCSYGPGGIVEFMSPGGTNVITNLWDTQTNNYSSSFTVNWNSPGIFALGRELNEQCGNNYVYAFTIQVFPRPQTPPAPVIIANCGSTITLGKNGSPGGAEEWLWQGQDDNGFSTNATSTYDITTPGQYFLRARDNACWSTSSSSITINFSQFGAVAYDPVVSYSCSNDGLSMTVWTDNENDRWFGSSSSTTPLSSTNSYTVSLSVNSLYVESYDNQCVRRIQYPIDAATQLRCGTYLNSISTLRPTSPAVSITGTTPLNQKTVYLDGLGREVQSISVMGSPQQKDIVQPRVYDESGREFRNYLPFTSDESNGAFKDITYSVNGNYMNSFYANPADKVADDDFPFSEVLFEPSPLNRILKQGSPGAAWQPSGNDNDLDDHTVKKRYGFNEQNSVIKFVYDHNSGLVTADSGGGIVSYYDANELFANTTYDEENNVSIEFVDKEGKTICKKVQYAGDVNNPLLASTYYIFDAFGQLVIVIPPEAVNSAINELTQN